MLSWIHGCGRQREMQMSQHEFTQLEGVLSLYQLRRCTLGDVSCRLQIPPGE